MMTKFSRTVMGGGLFCAALLLTACSDDTTGELQDAAPDITPDLPKPDLFNSGLPDGYGPLYACKDVGKTCNAHDPCAIDPVCGPDHKCRPTSLQDCDDKQSCTVDTCAGLGVCKNIPKAGTCLLGVVTGGGGDAGSGDAGGGDAGGGDAGAAADLGAKTTTFSCFKTGDRNPNDTCMACSPTEYDGGATNNTKWMPASGGYCDDKEPCTQNDTCVGGVCKGTSFASKCSDSYSCTTDLCDGKGGCLGNKLKSGWCLINATCYKKDATHPSGTCFTCDPSSSTSSWTAITNTCTIGGKCYNKGATHSGGCAECDPTTSTSKWTVAGATHCLISNLCTAKDKKDTTGCAICDPSKDKYDWTALPNLCKIDSKCYSKGAKNSGGCAECDPATSTSKWTVKGTTHCYIDKKCYATGTADSTGCATCEASKDVYKWTPKAGLCKIASKCYSKGAKHPKGCAECKPASNTTDWTLTSTTHCMIGHECYASGYTFGCFKCDPTKSQTAWTKLAGCNKVETMATATSSGGGTGTHGATVLNDGLMQSTCKFCWVSAKSTPGSSWIMYTWKAAVTVNQIKIDTIPCATGGCGMSSGRCLAGGTLQYWDSSAWKTIGTITPKADDWSYSFTKVTTTRLRLYGIHAATTGTQTSNPVIFEWQVYGP